VVSLLSGSVCPLTRGAGGQTRRSTIRTVGSGGRRDLVRGVKEREVQYRRDGAVQGWRKPSHAEVRWPEVAGVNQSWDPFEVFGGRTGIAVDVPGPIQPQAKREASRWESTGRDDV